MISHFFVVPTYNATLVFPRVCVYSTVTDSANDSVTDRMLLLVGVLLYALCVYV